MSASTQFLAKPTWNPVEVITDTRVSMTGLGMLGAYMARKYAYTNFRQTFGYAIKDTDGRVRYVDVDNNGNPVRNREVPGAYVNRLLWNLGSVVLGSLIIGQVDDANADYIGLGIAAGGISNTIMTLFSID